MHNPTDNQTPQPVDNELDEILDELNIEYNEYRGEMYHIDPLKYEKKIRPIAKARLLQWGTRQRVDELESITGFSKVGGVYTKAGVDTTKPNWQPISTQERKEKLQASLKDGGNDEH